MGIQNLYNTTAILEKYLALTNSYGEEAKTWYVSTTVLGTRQGRSGNEAITNSIEKASYNERFYCDVINIDTKDRLIFSTNTYIYKGEASTDSDLSSTQLGSMYHINQDFSTYTEGEYAIYNGTTYIKNPVIYRDIDYLNSNLRGNHYQLDLKETIDLERVSTPISFLATEDGDFLIDELGDVLIT
jgi:hypothetical protein